MSTLQTWLTSGGLVALGAVIGAVLGGVITNWLGDRRDRRRYAHEQTMAAQAQRHEQAMAVEARRQERLERTYHELLGYLKHHADWALAVRPLIGPVEVPPELTREEVRRVEALVEAHGSLEVRALMREWRVRAGRIAEADAIIGRVERSRRPTQGLVDKADEEQEALKAYRDAMFDAAEAIRERVRQELAGEA
jgi:hypothetical protein